MHIVPFPETRHSTRPPPFAIVLLGNMHEDTYWDRQNEVFWTGQVSRELLEPMFDRIIDKYLTLDSYYRINDQPVFSLFDTGNFVAGLGGVEEAQDAFGWIRKRCKAKGLPGIDLQAIARLKSGGNEAGALLDEHVINQAARTLGFDSATSYQFCMEAGDHGDYADWANKAIARWPAFEATYGTYYPHVSIGWDNTQRNPSFKQEHVIRNETPEAFAGCLRKAKDWLDQRPQQAPLVTINSWNEWTEGSYLLPDEHWGYRYLQAVKNVFRPSH